MDKIRYVRNILFLLMSFAAGVLVSYFYFVDTQILDALRNPAILQLLTPTAILSSAAIATAGVYAGLRENQKRHLIELTENRKRHQEELTIKSLDYRRFTWEHIRRIKPTLEEINSKHLKLTKQEFHDYILQERTESEMVAKMISYLDSYQAVAYGVLNGIYHEQMTKLLIGPKLCFIYKQAKCYIEWRRGTKLPAQPIHTNLFQEIEELAVRWEEEFEREGVQNSVSARSPSQADVLIEPTRKVDYKLR